MQSPNWPVHTGDVSFWYQDIGGLPSPRPSLEGDTEADVCIVGAGYTGLWTAYYLKKAKPELNIVMVEAEFAGFGASGRNGGWLTGTFAWNQERYLTTGDAAGVWAMVDAMSGSVDEIVRLAEAEGIDADIHRTSELLVATNPGQLVRLKEELQQRRQWGEADRVRELSEQEAKARVQIPGALGAMEIGNVARIQPAKLVQGLAKVVEQLGVRIAESTRVTRLEAGRAVTDRGTVTAPIILRATEGFTATLDGSKRDWLPLNSAQIVTEPLSEEVWAQIGWDGREIVGDFANAYCYCQRTREGRIAVGSRGLPYRLGSKLDHRGTPDSVTIRNLMQILHRHFPAASKARVDHAWCGVLGVPRDWCATVGLDPKTGIGWAGGYVGVGVSTSNLAGRTLCDLTLGRDTDLTRLPWVNRRVRRWEPEPLRWLGVRGMHVLLNSADRHEAKGGPKPSRLALLGYWLAGH
ncbi:MAG: FAD-binding oxidoreductase [Natronospirillum sp.]|uniref:NAD(P)/FAD-dependent oxidoreductase n=1 Tax=Natronospirillum sp. TaxID=2812955 RepID=UPI0025F238FD|nr:FAD-binding oxidoreductase [Natronospirillum sp.]MCH8552481.1 FAD-binding oxidoreductase [Natronospirillum sp.]